MVLGNQDAAISRNFYPRSESSQHDVNFHLQHHMNQDYWDQDQIYHASDLNTIDYGDDEHNNWSGQLIHNNLIFLNYPKYELMANCFAITKNNRKFKIDVNYGYTIGK